jgi:uncharacterized protein (DUF433 family)
MTKAGDGCLNSIAARARLLVFPSCVQAKSSMNTSLKDIYMNRITLEPGKRGGRPCIRGLRITVYDVLSMLSSGMSQQEIQDNFPELVPEDILAALAYAAEREHQVYSYRVQ